MIENNKRDQEIEWLAFLYVAGEMSAEESTSFEMRLVDDQAAREAVARAIELTEVTAMATEYSREPAVAMKSTNTWLRRLAWMSCGAAACLVGILITFAISRGTWNGETSPSGESRNLALAWASSRTDLSGAAVELVDESHSVPVLSGSPVFPVSVYEGQVENGPDNNHDNGHDADPSAQDIETPSWMLMAVSGLTGDSPVSVPQ